MTAVTHEGERNANRPAWEVFPKRDGKDENQRVCLYIQKTMYRIVYPHNFGSVFQCIYLISKMEIFTNVFPIFVFYPCFLEACQRINPGISTETFQRIVKPMNFLHYSHFIQCFVTEQGVFIKIFYSPMHLLFDIDFHNWR